MRPSDFLCPLHRRTILRFSIGAAIASSKSIQAFAKTDFWNEKEASDWSDSERERLLSNSPWAKKATPSMGAGGDGGPGFGGPPGGGFPGGGGPMGGGMGRGGPQGAGGDIGGGPGGGVPDFQMTVRWESAAPIRIAGKEPVSDDPDSYLISLSGVGGRGRRAGGQRGNGQQSPEFAPPTGFAGGDNSPEAMTKTAQLEVKGKPPLHPGKVERLEGDQMALLFHFERAALPITPSTKEVVFSVRMGPMDLRVKFSPKEMVYKGQLAV